AALLSEPDPDVTRRHLQSAADRLLAAREVLYPVTIHVLDVSLMDEQCWQEPLAAAFEHSLPVNVVAAARVLQQCGRADPDRLQLLRERLAAEQAEVCGGPYREREVPLLPIESQLANLRQGLAAYKALLDHEVKVFARKRFGSSPQLPLLLT